MRRATVCALLAVGSVLGSTAWSQDAGEIVARCVETLGGPEAVAKWSDYEADGELTISMFGREMSGTIKVVQQGQKSWNRTEMDFRGRSFVGIQAYDGAQAFSERMGTVADIPTLNFESDLDHTVALLTAPGTSTSLAKETEIEGRRVVGVEISHGGKKTTFYIDIESYALAEIVFEDSYFGRNDTKEMLEKRVRYSEYRLVDGVYFPMTMGFFEKGSRIRELRFAKVAFAPAVPADRFARPDEELDLRYGEERID